MPRIVIDNQQLFDGSRADQAAKLVAPLARKKAILQPAWLQHPTGKVLSLADQFTSVRRDERQRHFSTRIDSLYCQYFELWRSEDQGRNWFLEQANLHLLGGGTGRGDLAELVMIHAEPETATDTYSGRAKAGPHLHMKVDSGRLRVLAKAHIPLNLCHLDEVLGDVSQLDAAMASAVIILGNDVLDRFSSIA